MNGEEWAEAICAARPGAIVKLPDGLEVRDAYYSGSAMNCGKCGKLAAICGRDAADHRCYKCAMADYFGRALESGHLKFRASWAGGNEVLAKIFPGDPPQYVTPAEQLPCDTELSQEIKKRLPTDPNELDRIWKAVEDIAKGT